MFQVIVFERGDLIFVFNFHPENAYDGYFFFKIFILSCARCLCLLCKCKCNFV